jgi:drug/metabolite transporter (DMT)-like permease
VPKITRNGPLVMFISAVLFSIMAIMVKIAGATIPAAEIIFFRSLVSVVIILTIMNFRKPGFKIVAKDKLIVRGIVGGISLILYFYALTMTSVANAVTLDNTYPIFAAIFAVIYLNERFTLDKFFFLFTAFAGMLIMFRFNFSSMNTGDLLAIAAAVGSGIAIITIRELGRTDSTMMITFSFVLSGLILSLFFMTGHMITPTTNELFILFFLGIFGTFGQIFMTYGYKHCSAALGGIISMSSIVITAVMSVFIFGDPLTINMIIGGLLIFASAAFFSTKEQIEEAAK